MLSVTERAWLRSRSVRGDPGGAAQGKRGAGRARGSQEAQPDLQAERAQGAAAVPVGACAMGVR